MTARSTVSPPLLPRLGRDRPDALTETRARRPRAICEAWHGRSRRELAAWGASLGLPSVRGLVAGRALLYPLDGGVAAAVDIAAGLVHGGGR